MCHLSVKGKSYETRDQDDVSGILFSSVIGLVECAQTFHICLAFHLSTISVFNKRAVWREER